MSKENFPENVDFLNLRRQAGLTLATLAALSGYSIAAINGLELKNSGSKRMREKVKTILSECINCENKVSGTANSQIDLNNHQQTHPDKNGSELSSRVAALENEVRILKCALASLLPRS